MLDAKLVNMGFLCSNSAGLSMQNSLQERLKNRIRQSSKVVFFRKDFEGEGGYRQVSRALSKLEKQEVIVRAGYGLYTKPIGPDRRDAVLSEIKSKLGKRVKRVVEVGGITYQLGRSNQPKRNAQSILDDFKLLRAETVLKTIDMKTIREKSLDNLQRWKSKGTWCSAYDEWAELMARGEDAEVIEAMTGRDENSNRLRQSSPYTGLLDQEIVDALRASVRP
jgi:hypothetical protein